jgi:transcriptional regulator with XRE-family HTH domain
MTPKIGMRLKSLRKKRKLTRYALAQRAGLSRVHVKRLEEGQQSPTIDTVQRLAKALNVSLAELLGIR